MQGFPCSRRLRHRAVEQLVQIPSLVAGGGGDWQPGSRAQTYPPGLHGCSADVSCRNDAVETESVSLLAPSQAGLRSRPLSATLIKPVFTQGRGAHQMLLPIPKYGHGQNARGGGWFAGYVRPSAGPQTMPLPRLAMCNCLTTGYSFPLEILAGPLCPISSSCHIPELPLLNGPQIPENTPTEGLRCGWDGV